MFVCFYLATWLVLGALRFPFYWNGLASVTVATILCIGILERGQWPLGLFVPPRLALPEFGIGLAWGALLVGGCALLIVLSTDVRHQPGRGFPWVELIAVFAPAVLHEELLFRGYAFQKLLHANRLVAYLFVSFLFAALHAGNTAVTLLGLTNVFLGGILLSLAYELYGRLWMPIGLHLAWNLMTGPILGHEVSGYTGEETLFVERGSGVWWLTGGNFGIEGSVWMTVIELAGIAILAWQHMIRTKERNP
ncbi:MAG TPA: CPBP family intramembrane glutamic endopeptidase [Thermoanaerobaculia bacterium]|nr:CPBP family intramembrane glutamic endopeptidase [Thermoanaerobaculia bacterium]